ncbi:MAG: hypothetical protein A2X19_06275 [Bacteroidetes bacterium GWE2_39_28]|nr:MAG: hypothetical protein A2X19_06275 [Bacteroidetes bacterium GWE2_39_28]OFY12846.1 MAG: hypothetical protein A2X16_01055 [Bacteroidetes bacterium GWF2_39_10]OFZ10484.1 MAG: hypothetical protein A2465_01495 [Bacteroidetes bacterium RIFOXYC2_FULL_39_11]HCT93674.1 hypothetical protein [Rikenellaceae bacterium]
MKEIERPEQGTYEVYHLISEEHSYTEYVLELAEAIAPFCKEVHSQNYYCSPLYVAFLFRYFGNKVNKSFLKDYENDKELKEMIIALGYDFEKFWYLLLFIYDYTYSSCKKILELEEDNTDNLKDICKYICEEGAALTLKVNKEKKVVIKNSRSLHIIHKMLNQHLESKEGDSFSVYRPKNNDWNATKEGTDSYHIWYFTLIFLKFFKVCPPLKKRQKKGEIISLNKRLLISKLVYLLKISRTGKFEPSESILNAFLKQYKNEPTPRFNKDYLLY